MSLQAYTAVWTDKRPLNPGPKIVLLVLADYAWPSGWAFPSTGTIAEMAGLSRRHCVRLLDFLEKKKFIMVIEGGGWNGTDLYGITAVCKGKFQPPTPDEIAKAMRSKTPPRNHRTPPDRMSPPLTGCHHDISYSKCHPNHKLTNPPQLFNGEVPSEDEVKAFGATYPGMLTVGIPAQMPLTWVQDWYDFYAFDRGRFPANWKELMRRAFQKDWQNGHPKARGQQSSMQVGVNLEIKNGGIWHLKQRLDSLKNREKVHEANEESTSFMNDATPEQIEDLEKLRGEIISLEMQLGMTK